MKKIFALLISAMLGLGIVGCIDKDPQNLEEYYDISENRAVLVKQLNNENIESGSIYLKIDFDVLDNLMIYKYTFATPVQANSISKSIEMSLTEDFINDKITALETDTGFEGISVQYIYYGPDNTELFNRTFNKK